MFRRLACGSLLVVLSAGLAPVACNAPGTGFLADVRAGSADTLLTLAVGQEARAPDGVLRVAFLAVSDDSRCPTDVQCVWAGNAAVELGIAYGMGPTVRHVLNTGIEPRGLDLGLYRLTMAELSPAPVSTATIPPDRYVVSLRLQRLPLPD
jgi:hypothetical protein